MSGVLNKIDFSYFNLNDELINSSQHCNLANFYMLLDEYRTLKNIDTSAFGLLILTFIFSTDHWAHYTKKKLIEGDKIETLFQENVKLLKFEFATNEVEFDPKIFGILISMVRLVTIKMTCQRYQKSGSELGLSPTETDWVIGLTKVVKETFSFEFGDQSFNEDMEKLRIGQVTPKNYFSLKDCGQKILTTRILKISKRMNFPHVSS